MEKIYDVYYTDGKKFYERITESRFRELVGAERAIVCLMNMIDKRT